MCIVLLLLFTKLFSQDTGDEEGQQVPTETDELISKSNENATKSSKWDWIDYLHVGFIGITIIVLEYLCYAGRAAFGENIPLNCIETIAKYCISFVGNKFKEALSPRQG